MPTQGQNRRPARRAQPNEHSTGVGAMLGCHHGLLVCLCLVVQAASVSAELDRARLVRIDTMVEEAIRDGRLPGAVVVVGHAGEIVYEGVFGVRALDGPPQAMTLDTIFDLASLTKVVATTTSVMILVEEGRLRLRDRVVTYLPEFASHGKDRITVEHLLTHVSGLRPDLPLGEVFEGAATAIARAADEVPEASPGERFVYSDINFFVLGEIVRRVSGQTLDRFARDRIFQPLEMTDTGFNPPSSLVRRIAPTEPCAPLAWPCGGDGAVMLRGRVHDPIRRGGWVGSPVMQGCSAPPATWLGSAGCCWAAGRSMTCAYSRRSRSRG